MWRSPSCCWRKWQSAETRVTWCLMWLTREAFEVSLAKWTQINMQFSMHTLSILSSLKLPSVSHSRRKISPPSVLDDKRLNTWPLRLRRWSHSKRSSLHTSCASLLFKAAIHKTVPSQPMVIYPFELSGEQLYKLRFGQYLWTFNGRPPESMKTATSIKFLSLADKK